MSTEDSQSVNGYRSILALIVFLLTNIVVIFPFHIRIPNPFPRANNGKSALRIPLNLNTVPPLAVLLLLACRVADGSTLRRGILGSDGIKPIDIMALFISLAYISISLDATGLLRFLAFWIVSKSNSGKKLYAGLYLLFFGFGAVVGNDPVILSGTAFLAYMTRVAGIVPPTAWIFAQFCAANIASAILVSSNPTNLVLTGAFQVSFTSYTANVILPSLATALLVFPYLLWLFGPDQKARLRPALPRSQQSVRTLGDDTQSTAPPSADADLIPTSLQGLDLPDPSSALVDKRGAQFGSALLLSTLACLLATSAAGAKAQVWMITVPAALIMLARDLWWDLWGSKRRREPDAPQSPQEDVSVEPTAEVPSTVYHESERIELRRINTSQQQVIEPNQTASREASPSRTRTQSLLSEVEHALPTCYTVFTRLPFPLIPFAFSMFILVQTLGNAWISVFATWWTAWVNKTGPVGAVLGMYFVSVAGCNFMGTNIGATILLARVLQQWEANHAPPERVLKGSIYALALGSNFGAFSACFCASLAGLLWRTILNQKGIQIRQTQFAKLNIGISVVAMTAGCGVLLIQIYARA